MPPKPNTTASDYNKELARAVNEAGVVNTFAKGSVGYVPPAKKTQEQKDWERRNK